MEEQALGYLDTVIKMAIEFAPKLLTAIAIIVIGFWLVKKLTRILEISFEKANLDPAVRSFMTSFINGALKILILIVAASRVGIEMTSLVALLAAAGFAVGMALQGSLANFAAGIMILVFKPYKIDDWVEVSEKFGKVESVQIFTTTVVTPGYKTHIIPNGQVMDGVITNFSDKGKIKLELNVTMPYAESFPKVKAVIESALKNVESVSKETPPDIGIESYDTHFVVLAVRPFIDPDHYWTATFDCMAAIKKAFSDNNIQMSYSEGIELGDIGD